jgi:hypothetical protein
MGLPEAQAGVASAAGGAEGFEAFYVREYHRGRQALATRLATVGEDDDHDR